MKCNKIVLNQYKIQIILNKTKIKSKFQTMIQTLSRKNK